MNIIVLGFMIAFVIFASANGTKVARCKSTFRSSQDPACSMLTTYPNNSMMCTSADVFSDISGYFSVDNDVVPLCLTYIFKSDPPVGTDDFPEGIWLYRGVNFDSRFSTCEKICELVRITTAGTNYKNFYVGCHLAEDGNSENVTDFWPLHTQYDCSTDDKYYNKNKPAPIEVTTTPAPSTTKKSTIKVDPTASSSTAEAVSTTGLPTTFFETFVEVFAKKPVAEVAAETTAAPGSSNANLFIGIAQGVIGILGTAIIATSAVVLYLTCKKLPRGDSPSE